MESGQTGYAITPQKFNQNNRYVLSIRAVVTLTATLWNQGFGSAADLTHCALLWQNVRFGITMQFVIILLDIAATGNRPIILRE
jgi:hypothetical protein